MKNIYTKTETSNLGKRALRIGAIIIMIMVWILIDKGNIYGQSLSDMAEIEKAEIASDSHSALLREGDDSDEREVGIEGDGYHFVVRPNPVQRDLVFDFEFTVKHGIPYQIHDALGRMAGNGTFEPGISTQSIDFSALRAGLYFVNLDLGDRSEVRRIIKR